jgi:hypothetical protein
MVVTTITTPVFPPTNAFGTDPDWRNPRVPPNTQFLGFPPIHRAGLEGQQRVDLTHLAPQSPNDRYLREEDGRRRR